MRVVSSLADIDFAIGRIARTGRDLVIESSDDSTIATKVTVTPADALRSIGALLTSPSVWLFLVTLLAARSEEATVCPSEIARAFATPETWRDAMSDVHRAVDHLLADGMIRLSWKGRPLATRAGPYRISRTIP